MATTYSQMILRNSGKMLTVRENLGGRSIGIFFNAPQNVEKNQNLYW